jgi:hypothetical protein
MEKATYREERTYGQDAGLARVFIGPPSGGSATTPGGGSNRAGQGGAPYS